MVAWHKDEETCKCPTASAYGAIYGLLIGKDLRAVHKDNTGRERECSNERRVSWQRRNSRLIYAPEFRLPNGAGRARVRRRDQSSLHSLHVEPRLRKSIELGVMGGVGSGYESLEDAMPLESE
jgi:hypothetical protein